MKPPVGKVRVGLPLPPPIGTLWGDAYFDGTVLRAPLLPPLPWDDLADGFGGGGILVECLGGSWRATANGFPASGPCASV